MIPQPTKPTRLKFMHDMHGARPGQVCAHCLHYTYFRTPPGLPRHVCDQYADKQHYPTIWARNWPACGKFEALP